MPHQTLSHLNFTPTFKLFTPQGSVMTGIVEVICHRYVSIKQNYEVQIYNVAYYSLLKTGEFLGIYSLFYELSNKKSLFGIIRHQVNIQSGEKVQ
jgi:hypothetical protein